jgi:hypothetical protein
LFELDIEENEEKVTGISIITILILDTICTALYPALKCPNQLLTDVRICHIF